MLFRSTETIQENFHGLFIVLKRIRKFKVSAEQIRFGARMKARGYATAICNGADAAWKEILAYLGVKDPR